MIVMIGGSFLIISIYKYILCWKSFICNWGVMLCHPIMTDKIIILEPPSNEEIKDADEIYN